MIKFTLKISVLILFLMTQTLNAATIVLNINNNNSTGTMYTHPTTAVVGDIIQFTNNLPTTISAVSPLLTGNNNVGIGPNTYAANSIYSYTVTASSPTNIKFIYNDVAAGKYYNNQININNGSVPATTITFNINNGITNGDLFTHPTTAKLGDIIKFTNNLQSTIFSNSKFIVGSDGVGISAGANNMIIAGGAFSYTVVSTSPAWFNFSFTTNGITYNNRININKNTELKQVKKDLTLSPNPAKNYVYVGAKGIVEISDLNGKIIYTENVTHTNKMDLTNIPSGTYIIRIKENCNLQSSKLVVIK